jgi:hypothetical protein
VTKDIKMMSTEEFEGTVLAKVTKRYIVMGSQGQGGIPIEDFDTLDKALAFTEEHEGEMNFGIIYPNGEWHEWK